MNVSNKCFRKCFFVVFSWPTDVRALQESSPRDSENVFHTAPMYETDHDRVDVICQIIPIGVECVEGVFEPFRGKKKKKKNSMALDACLLGQTRRRR